MRYLGLTLDSRYHFGTHFDRLVPRALYVGVVRSMVLYGAPVWARDLVAGRRSKMKLRRIER
ncbi:hypothetical protein WH47_04216 [Habropoda laboriosa]|uniref:Uncharacterized protein n=1 Tax=Habropoda laboriosa TaxID=597456 RepID=A0A0L7QV94_9HYME|nr:hypothetical protein WH47_04216 [Habropoda laboriosa]